MGGESAPAQNAYQVADWNGASGQRWVANQARLDAMLDVFGEATISAAAPTSSERVLDVGCGTGASSLALAGRVGSQGFVLGLDISEPLIARARECTPVDAPITFEVADASCAPLREGTFHLLFSRFGVMFFDDPTAAFAHMRRALCSGGRLAFICWRSAAENEWARLPLEAISAIIPPPPPADPEAPGPFSFNSRARISQILTAAGFADIVICPFDHAVPFGQGATREAANDDAMDMAFQIGPLSRILAGQTEGIRDKAAAFVRAAFAGRPGQRSVLIDGATWIVTARNPAGQLPAGMGDDD